MAERAWGKMLLRLAGFAILLSLVLAGLLYSRRLLRSASVLYSIAQKRPPLVVVLYNSLFGYKQSVHDLEVESGGEHLQLRVYEPIGRDKAPTIVVVHGTVPDGNRSVALNALAGALVRQGFRVVMPQLPAETRFIFDWGDVLRIGQTIRWAAMTGGDTVSVFGVSFGAGLAVPAAALPGIHDDVRLVFSISGYNDLARIGRYYAHLPVFGPDGKPYPVNHMRGTALIFGRAYLADLMPAEDVAPFAKILDAMVTHSEFALSPGDPLLAGLSPDQVQLFFALQDVETPEVQQRFNRLITLHKAQLAAVSPESVLPTLGVPFYALHGRDDLSIPLGELHWMQSEVPADADAHFYVTPWMAHVVIRNAVESRERLRAGSFLADVLTRAAS